MSKMYYWLRLKDDFFRSREIKKLRKIAGGDTYVIIYLKMQLISIQNNGAIAYEGTEDNIAEQIALEIDECVDNVRMTIAFLNANGLLTISENLEDITLTTVSQLIGKETDTAERMRKSRASKCNIVTGVLQCGYTEKEKEKEKEDNTYASGHLSDICPNSVEPQEKPLPTVVDNDSISDFEWFWNTYDKKKDLKRVKAKFLKLSKEVVELIKNTLPSYIASTPEKYYRKYPLTYLNGECWNDEIVNRSKTTPFQQPTPPINQMRRPLSPLEY